MSNQAKIVSVCMLFICFLAGSLIAGGSEEFRLYKSDEPFSRPEFRGRWSQSENEEWFDLTAGWTASNLDSVQLGEIDIPFLWEGYKGDISLVKNFILPDRLASGNIRLVIEGVSQSITLALNNVRIDTRHGDGISFQLDIDPRLLNFAGKNNTLLITLNNELSRSSNLPLKGSIFSRRRFGGISGGVYLVFNQSPSILDVEAVWTNDSAIGKDVISLFTDIRASLRNLDQINEDINSLNIRILNTEGQSLFVETVSNVKIPSSGKFGHKIIINPDDLTGMVALLNGGKLIVECTFIQPGGEVSKSIKFGANRLKVKGAELSHLNSSIPLRCVNYPDIPSATGQLPGRSNYAVDFETMKNLGIDIVRIWQGSGSPEIMEVCEEKGIGVLLELPLFQTPDPILADDEFLRSAVEQTEALVKRYRRYTSVAGWGLGSFLNQPNIQNRKFYTQIAGIIRQLDNRPIYASFPFDPKVEADPLDFVILEVSSQNNWRNRQLPKSVHSDIPIIISGVSLAVEPGKIGGYTERWTESAQADYLLKRVIETEKLAWCGGIVIGEFSDWYGEIPAISGPLKGNSSIYTTGLTDIDRLPRLAFHRLKEYWDTGRLEPIPPGVRDDGSGALIIIVGIVLIAILNIAARQNNLFKFNLFRNLTSSRGFFQDIGERRFFQTGQTLLLAMLLAGGVALIGAAWLYTQRHNYTLDWAIGWLIADERWIGWAASIIWHPIRSLLFFWGLAFFMIWCLSTELIIICQLLGRRCSLAQGLDFTTWTASGFLALLPLGIVAEKLFMLSGSWVILVVLILLFTWSFIRLIYVIARYLRKSVGLVAGLIATPPLIILISLFALLEHSREISLYWSFFQQLSR